MRTTEVANWLNFTLIAFTLAYRGFYALVYEVPYFFWYGVLGVGVFVGLAYLFYYGRVFAGGDAKLLMGYGGVLPFTSITSLITITLTFLLVFFVAGILYTLVYSGVLVARNTKGFTNAFKKEWSAFRKLFIAMFFVGLGLEIVLASGAPLFPYGFWVVLFSLLPLLVMYARALERGIMIVRVAPTKLTEGDWLDRAVTVGKTTIEPSVHGLTKKEILFLLKHKKNVWIKRGIPFTPTFLISLFVLIWSWYSFGRFALF